MKKILITILLSALVGCTFGYLLFKSIDDSIGSFFYETKELTFFQAGVFTDEENATDYANSFKSSTVVKEGDFYRVYLAILSSPESIRVMKEYFEKNNIEYHLRKLDVRENLFTGELLKYENILMSSKMDSTLDAINQMILEKFEESI